MASRVTVGDVMLRHPKTLPSSASVGEVRAALSDDHVHMVLLTEGERLVGTLTHVDLPPPGTGGAAQSWSRLEGRTVSPEASADVTQQGLASAGTRRVAVVGTDDELLGLMCLKRRWTGFCSDADVESRARETTMAGREAHG